VDDDGNEKALAFEIQDRYDEAQYEVGRHQAKQHESGQFVVGEKHRHVKKKEKNADNKIACHIFFESAYSLFSTKPRDKISSEIPVANAMKVR
jgi:hypothetical protein